MGLIGSSRISVFSSEAPSASALASRAIPSNRAVRTSSPRLPNAKARFAATLIALSLLTATSLAPASAATREQLASETTITFDSAAYDLRFEEDGALTLLATFSKTTAGSQGASDAASKVVGGASGLQVAKNIVDEKETYSVTIAEKSAGDFERAYSAWAGADASVMIDASDSDFFAQRSAVEIWLDAPQFLAPEAKMTAKISLVDGSHLAPYSIIEALDPEVDRDSLLQSGEFPVSTKFQTIDRTLSGAMVNVAVGLLGLGLIIVLMRTLIRTWDKNRRQSVSSTSNQ